MLASPSANPPWEDDDGAVPGSRLSPGNAQLAPEELYQHFTAATGARDTDAPFLRQSQHRPTTGSGSELVYSNEARGHPSPPQAAADQYLPMHAPTSTPVTRPPQYTHSPPPSRLEGPQPTEELPIPHRQAAMSIPRPSQVLIPSTSASLASQAPRHSSELIVKSHLSDHHSPRSFKRYKDLWPNYFSLAILATFGAPIVSGLHLAQDPSVKYWVGSYGYIPGLIPAYLALCHAVHMRRGPPKLIPVVLSTIVPCVIVLLVGNFHMSATGIIANMLLSKDCTTFHKKQDVHQAWVVAADLYESCINRTTVEKSIKYEDGIKLYRLHECKEYYPQFYGQNEDPWEQYRAKWKYLRDLEENAYCSGWCWETRPLWSFAEVKDPCSVAAGAMLMGKVKPLAVRMMVYGMVALSCTILGITYTAQLMRQEGIEWDRF